MSDAGIDDSTECALSESGIGVGADEVGVEVGVSLR